jgi:long-subunit acyl-CoA synthetase (AMP-forming)
LCPLVRSNVEGTPNLKFIGIFSENRKEWFITELAACSNSIVTVPVAVEPQFLDHKWICQVIDTTELTTLCVSQKTIGLILELKQKGKLEKLTNLITFDRVDEKLLELASTTGIELL